MINLTAEQIKLAEQLLITVIKKEPHVEYKELGDRVTPPIHQRQVPRNIGIISELCFELSLPFLSAKVVSKGINTPGSGFYTLYTQYYPEAKKLTPREVFREECKKIRECQEWYKLADYLNLDIDFPRLNANSKPTIRIIPMSRKNEFPGMSIEDVQNIYFLSDLAKKYNGKFYYRNNGINADKGSLLLFQFDNMIIASAKLLEVEKYDKPLNGKFNGAYILDVNSIKTFQPITVAEINRIDNKITGFSQAKQELNPIYKPQVEELIKLKQTTLIPEEIPIQEIIKLKEGAKKQILVNSYERNYKARQVCLEYHGSICCICGFDFGKFYGEEFSGKIHVHHLKALSEIDEEYEVDPINDLCPVCPNCHLALHSKINNEFYSISELKEKINNIINN